MKLLLVISCIALASADVSHILKSGGYSDSGFDSGASYDTFDLGGGSEGGHEGGYDSYSSGGATSFSADNSGSGAGGSSLSGNAGGGNAVRFDSYSSGGGSGGSFSSGGGSSFGGGSSGGSSGGDAGFSGGSGQLETGKSGFLDYSSGSGNTGGGKIVKPIIKHGAPLVSKSFFVHEAPAEQPTAGVDVETKETVVRPRKHYNIVFVKTPVGGAGGSVSSNNVNVFPENEEKTIIYVLNGRADGLQVDSNGEVQLPQPKAPSKPEVVFVKYNSEADAQRAISDIQSQYNSQGSSVSVIGSGSSAGGSSGYRGSTGGGSSVRSGAGGSSSVSGGHSGGSHSGGSHSGGSHSGGSHSGGSHTSGSTSFTSQTESKPIRSVRYRRQPVQAAAATAFQIQKSRELVARKLH